MMTGLNAYTCAFMVGQFLQLQVQTVQASSLNTTLTSHDKRLTMICSTPSNFPTSIQLLQQMYVNWAQEIVVPHVLTAIPRNADEVLLLVKWAALHGYRIRAVGFSHTWAPTTVTPNEEPCPKLLLVYTLPHLDKISLDSTEVVDGAKTGVIRAQPGASLYALLSFAEKNGLGFHNHPASGDHSVGGILAIGGHGCGVLTREGEGSVLPPGYTLGSVSNLILSVTAVVWDEETTSYGLHTFTKGLDDDAPAFFTHLGRTFVTEVTLQAGPLLHLRCVSHTDVPASELFADPVAVEAASKAGAGLRTVQSLMDTAGAFEVILFAFTDVPWLKVWTVSPNRPATSRSVTTPFNYPFSYVIPSAVSALIDRINAGVPDVGAKMGPLLFEAASVGLTVTLSRDIWGPAKNVLLFVKPSTLRTTNGGWCILTKRENVQLISHTVYAFYTLLLKAYSDRGEYPINVGFELRVGGADAAGGPQGQDVPWLSSASPFPLPLDPEYDAAIWVEVLTLPSTPSHPAFMREMEQFLYGTYSLEPSSVGLARPEWSKGWAYTAEAGWDDHTVLQELYPTIYPNMEAAKGVYAKYDPDGVISNTFLDGFL